MERNLENRLYEAFVSSCGVSTDSRRIEKGQMFFALKGDNFDGNRFAAAALEAGAAVAVVSADSGLADGDRIIVVEDTLEALQVLARMHRSRFRIPVIGLTGTNGKTTTKELICAVLSAKYKVTATEGNLNNHIGVPLTLLRITGSTEIAVIEMGANHPGEIAALAGIALPDYGLVTNVGKAHLEGFGSFEGVKRTKGELYDYLQRTGDTVFLNADDHDLCAMAAQRPDLRIVRYGVEASGAEIMPVTESLPYLRLALADGFEVDTHLIGGYNAPNVMAALCVGQYFGVPTEAAAAAVRSYVPSNLRSQLDRTDRNLLVLDTYNANPSSMKASLCNFAASNFPHKVLILGQMLELGEDSVEEHRKVISRVAGMSGCERAVFVGGEFEKAADGFQEASDSRFEFCSDVDQARRLLENSPLSGCTVLLKGSNAVRLPLLKDVL
ncbi:MAG TPA: UDP-N-acetylmuramoyl-tripeptide--D-alanyl-D-alanine ligase [Candidatus Coprenecus stercoravium]|uniref:UDP-N-acetylmuramoyl-tripeptide--D-alanyl-D-alanine ligase n=1 Tax=Candidatus Coprenecus stercoravium TaxID=2840735 RepID=A0A9D2GQK3_9BACT|nr:UDP-N-acetylmuramoyl-tripeptide--D-alanyl-D-alanine ligase [Candidatus Coprenecus stercoravium]